MRYRFEETFFTEVFLPIINFVSGWLLHIMLHGLIDNVAVKVSWMVTKVVPQSKTIHKPASK